MSELRSAIAAAVIAVAGFAGSANATTINPNKVLVNPNLKIHFCLPHYERKIINVGYYKLIVISYVDRFCHRHVVRVIRIPNRLLAKR